ncbi:MAG: SUMF1/EgtB/PvdO family nonheme iron enzyme [Luteitalea sp.]|nr:SUMF1/EgtB/PvdO family nonheme iron enzyme [Luteitalea sp.]
MVRIPAGNFWMGSEQGHPDERPVRHVKVDGFWIDRTPVTNARFAGFVDATDYVTTAERPLDPADFPGAPPEELVPGAVLFKKPKLGTRLDSYYPWWTYEPGASWRHPEGPETTLDGREQHPVVAVSWDDAVAFCKWEDKRLPTEAEWEYAARGGLERQRYVWGDEVAPGGRSQANTWQGTFPVRNTVDDGYRSTSPVGSFAPNGYGLYDMAGNVWEWTRDWYRPDYYSNAPAVNPTGPESSFDPDEPGIAKRVIRGGSFLCAPNYCTGYRPSARMKTSPDTGSSHTGFRCVGPEPPPSRQAAE